jgi:hypothetical protein
MRAYLTFLVSGALALIAFVATMLLQGGWQAVLAAFAVLAGAGCLTGLIALLTTGERLASPAPSGAHQRASARPAPAAKDRPEAAPEPAAPPEPSRPGPRTRPRLPSTAS